MMELLFFLNNGKFEKKNVTFFAQQIQSDNMYHQKALEISSKSLGNFLSNGLSCRFTMRRQLDRLSSLNVLPSVLRHRCFED